MSSLKTVCGRQDETVLQGREFYRQHRALLPRAELKQVGLLGGPRKLGGKCRFYCVKVSSFYNKGCGSVIQEQVQ